MRKDEFVHEPDKLAVTMGWGWEVGHKRERGLEREASLR